MPPYFIHFYVKMKRASLRGVTICRILCSLSLLKRTIQMVFALPLLTRKVCLTTIIRNHIAWTRFLDDPGGLEISLGKNTKESFSRGQTINIKRNSDSDSNNLKQTTIPELRINVIYCFRIYRLVSKNNARLSIT